MTIKKPESGKDTIGSKPSTDKPEISNNKKDKIRFHGSVTEEKNDVSSLVPVVNARDSKLAAMKKVVRKNKTNSSKLKLPKKVKNKKKESTNKPSRQSSRVRQLRSDVPKTTL